MNADKTKSPDAAQVFADFLTQTGRRHTPERTMVLDRALCARGRFAADDIVSALAQAGQRVSVATVYSTLQLMVDCGILVKLCFDQAKAYYQAAPANMHHAVCTVCGRVADIRSQQLDIQLRGLHLPRFTPLQASLTVYGICSACSRALRKAEKEKSRQSHLNNISTHKKL